MYLDFYEIKHIALSGVSPPSSSLSLSLYKGAALDSLEA